MNKLKDIISYWLSKIILKICNNEILTKFREIEKRNEKLIETRSHRLFNLCCINNGLLPSYTNVTLHDAAARTEDFTREFRKKLVLRQVEEQSDKIALLECEIKKLKNEFSMNYSLSELKLAAFWNFLERTSFNKEMQLRAKHNEKLCKLYGGPICMKRERQCFINLSNIEIKSEIAQIFELGMNCHLKSKYDNLIKKIEVEKLYRNICDEKRKNNLNITDEERLKCELKRFGLQNNRDYNKNNISKEQLKLIKEFNADEDIITRKADKSSIFVIMNRADYSNKINDILSDGNKFIKVDKDPTPQIKKKLRSLIDTVNANSNAPRMTLPVGNFEPGYIYGNAKIHKNQNDPPLRPIISQIGTVTYNIAKQLNSILTPYVPSKYMINSTQEFIDITSTFQGHGYLSSLDVENLFTNVPVNDTIKIIMECCYSNDKMNAPNIPKKIMEKLLKICTTETPFRNTNGDLYIQTDGVAMGSPLGPLFANFYMSYIENTVLPTIENKPLIYARYVDDVFLLINNISTLEEIKNKFESTSVLKFTYEIEEKKTISFLDVRITRSNNSLITTVHTKLTNSGECLNYNSIAPTRYKTAVIRTFLHRAYRICSNWQLLHHEIDRIKQLLSNNNFPMKSIEDEIQKFLNKKLDNNKYVINNNNPVKLYFKNQMTSQYKQDEHRLKQIISDYTAPTEENNHINLTIYYKSKKLKNLFIRNNSRKIEDSKKSHLVYQYSCPNEGCSPSTLYVGYTECALVDRMRNHTQSGSIMTHNRETHGTKLSTNDILEQTTILRHFHKKDDLLIAEALLIKEMNPKLNQQREGEARILSIF